MNDDITPESCSLEYGLLSHGYGGRHTISKDTCRIVDVKSAYQLVPVHPTDRQLLGVSWHGSVIVDTKLPFGVRSVPKIFNALADALEWCFWQKRGKKVEHYFTTP